MEAATATAPDFKITTRTAVFVGKCKACKKGARGTAIEHKKVRTERYRTVQGYENERTVYSYAYGEPPHYFRKDDRALFLHRTCPCGAPLTLRRVNGRISDHVCNAKCMTSTGPACECSCGGANHGAGLPLLSLEA